MEELSARLREAAKLTDAYTNDPNFIEQQFQLPSLDHLLAGEGVLGVARLIELASFESERLHTLVYSHDSVTVTTVRGATSLWSSIPKFARVNDSPELSELEHEPFVASEAERRSKTIALSSARMPSILASWSALLAAASAAPSCATLMFDGVYYRHRVRAQGVAIDASWENPEGRQHAAQIELLAAYTQLLDLADLFPEEREAAERRRLLNRENRLARKKRKEERRKRR
jgi:hypothetical protein